MRLCRPSSGTIRADDRAAGEDDRGLQGLHELAAGDDAALHGRAEADDMRTRLAVAGHPSVGAAAVQAARDVPDGRLAGDPEALRRIHRVRDFTEDGAGGSKGAYFVRDDACAEEDPGGEPDRIITGGRLVR